MNPTKPDNGAFPHFKYDKETGSPFITDDVLGLTKREYFAAMAMQGICQNPNHIGGYLSAASESLKHADALIAELNKPKP